jgi:signal transduction histidine kinase
MLVHDMKAPLTFMIGSLQMLEEQENGPLNPEQAELVELVLRGCNRLEGMITNILDINRLEEGKLDLSIAPVEPGQLLNDRMAVWQLSCRSQRKSLEIISNSSRRVIQTDRHLLERIMENLVSNAIKHTRPGTGKIRISVEDWKDRAGILIRVSDNGEGIPEAYREKIFDKYTTAKKQDLGMKSDTGLGLTFCKMAITVLGGEIWLESEPSDETSFCFYLPNETIPPATAQ